MIISKLKQLIREERYRLFEAESVTKQVSPQEPSYNDNQVQDKEKYAKYRSLRKVIDQQRRLLYFYLEIIKPIQTLKDLDNEKTIRLKSMKEVFAKYKFKQFFTQYLDVSETIIDRLFLPIELALNTKKSNPIRFEESIKIAKQLIGNLIDHASRTIAKYK